MTVTEEVRMRPKLANSAAQIELDKAQAQLDAFEDNVKSLTMDRMNHAPRLEQEQQTKLSQNQLANSKEIYLKPKRTIACREKFNESYRDAYNIDKEFVNFTAENKEIIGESLDMWTKPYAGIPAEEWIVPVNKPVWGPRYLFEQIKRKGYHRLIMKENVATGTDGGGLYYGQMAAETFVNRLDAFTVDKRRPVFMGSRNF